VSREVNPAIAKLSLPNHLKSLKEKRLFAKYDG
jgi:hypothetical protein